jgi:predicted aldo/keto reductase-like oxidoreductase
MVKTIRLGKTELRVSRVGFGGIPIQRLSENEAIAVVRRCLDLGVTFYDTATGYTTSEERIGKALAGRRDGVVLATKTPARDRETARAHLEQSLKRLNTDHVDIWQFHNVSTEEAYEQLLGPGGAMEVAQEAIAAGKVGHVGVSSHSPGMALKAVSSGLFATIQFPFNFVTHEALEELIPLARQHDVGFIAMKPLGGGLLENVRIAIKYLLQFDDILPDPGIQQVEEIDEIVRIVDGPWELTSQEQLEMDQIRAQVGTRFCHRCGYCQPCPEGVDIPTVLTIRSFHRRFPPERFRTGNIADAIAGARNCAECGECETKCPYHLPIREMLVENIAFYEHVTA